MSTDLLTALKEATATLDKAAAALLADAQARAAIADPAEWTRMPQKRCPMSNWSPSSLRRKVPIQKIDGTTFYSLAAVRKLLNNP